MAGRGSPAAPERSSGDRPAGLPASEGVPAGIRTVPPRSVEATRIVLVRHGEAVCNVSGVCGGPIGCGGLTDRGRDQVAALRDRLATTGELAGTGALYSSILARAVETADMLAPALGHDRDGRAALRSVARCDLCELHPGQADGLRWEEFVVVFGELDWDADPGRPIAPGGESWTGFVNRVSGALDALAGRHPGESVVVACHAGVIEASILAKIPVAGGLEGARLQLRTGHASMTTWEVDRGAWRLLGYNDAAHLAGLDGGVSTRGPVTWSPGVTAQQA